VIFVTVGTNEASFDRLLHAVDALPRREALVVQYGYSSVRPRGATLHEFLTFDEIVEHAAAARVVVTHAGVGSVTVALTVGKRPIVVPRLHRYGEAVDDHQVPFARRLAASGLVTLVEDPAELGPALTLDSSLAPSEAAPFPALAADLRSYIAAAVEARDAALSA